MGDDVRSSSVQNRDHDWTAARIAVRSYVLTIARPMRPTSTENWRSNMMGLSRYFHFLVLLSP